ncbi:hypothetical protein SAMN05660816_05435 [Niastella yeongjuensis]|nr:hypothetical protein SAMN05660816_05435 [Niastella yeongjuensis]
MTPTISLQKAKTVPKGTALLHLLNSASTICYELEKNMPQI